MARPLLLCLSGLPASGKTTLAKRLALELRAVYLRIDTVEQALRTLCRMEVQGEGYRLSYALARDNLELGLSVVADCCNPIELTRREWAEVARQAKARVVDIEVCCSDAEEHRWRVEHRAGDIEGLALPTWQEVLDRDYHPWSTARLVLDTAGHSPQESFHQLWSRLAAQLGRDC
jgi:predicted kinase